MFAAPAFAQSSKILKILQIADTLPEDKSFFRWQSKASGDNLVTHGKFDDKLYKYFMGMTVDRQTMAAGHGIYVCENPHSSSQFIRGYDSGSLIEVTLKKGTKFLDLTDSGTLSRLRSIGMTADDVYKLNPNLAVKYNGDSK